MEKNMYSNCTYSWTVCFLRNPCVAKWVSYRRPIEARSFTLGNLFLQRVVLLLQFSDVVGQQLHRPGKET